ncbi:hypothetical protein D3C72_742530 [compost metagenome]
MPFRIALLEHPLLAEGVKIRQIWDRLTGQFVQMTHPAFLSAAFGELLLNAEAFGQFCRHLVNGFTFEARFDHLVGKDDIRHVAARGIQREVHLFGGRAVRQQNIGIFRRRGHVAVDHHYHLAFFVILKDVVGAVDIRVLVDNAVARIVPDHLNRHVQLIFPAHTVAQGGHFWAAFNRIGPHKHGDTGLDWIFQRRHTFERHFIRAFARAGVAAVDADVAG